MKKNLYSLSRQTFYFLITSLLLFSCSKQNLPAKPQPSEFSATMENNQTSFSAAGGNASIIINGGTNGWWVTMPDNNWCIINKKYGSGEYSLPVRINPNQTGEARQLVITIHPTFDLPPVEITINQSN